MCVYISFMHQDYVDTYMYIYICLYIHTYRCKDIISEIFKIWTSHDMYKFVVVRAASFPLDFSLRQGPQFSFHHRFHPETVSRLVCRSPSSSFSSIFLNHGSQTLRDSVFISISEKIRERQFLSNSTKYITASDFWTTRWVATRVISIEWPGEDGIGVSWPTNLYQGTVHGKTVRRGISDPCWSRVPTPRTFCFEKYHGLGLKILLRKQKMRLLIILADSLPALIFWVLPTFSCHCQDLRGYESFPFTPMIQSVARAAVAVSSSCSCCCSCCFG